MGVRVGVRVGLDGVGWGLGWVLSSPCILPDEDPEGSSSCPSGRRSREAFLTSVSGASVSLTVILWLTLPLLNKLNTESKVKQ